MNIRKKKPKLKDDEFVDVFYGEMLKKTMETLIENKIVFNFEGFSETIKDYENLSSDDFSEAWKIAQDLILWLEYIGDFVSLIENLYYIAEDNETTEINKCSLKNSPTNLTEGKKAILNDVNVRACIKKKNVLKAFLKHLNNIYYKIMDAQEYCLSLYNVKHKEYLYKKYQLD